VSTEAGDDRDMFNLASAALHSHLRSGEYVIAEGRVEEARGEHYSALGYLVVTDLRILMLPGLSPETRPISLPIDELITYADADYAHRWYLHLHHRPMARLHHRSRWRVGFVLLGRNRLREALESHTFLRFSRRDSVVARAVRTHLQNHSVPRIEWDGPALDAEPEFHWP
jgi:hypothetical protein